MNELNSKDIRDYFNNIISIKELKDKLKPNVLEYEVKSKKKGASTPVYLREDKIKYTIVASHIINLCRAYKSGNLNLIELDIISTIIQLSEDFEFVSENVEEAMFLLSDREINGTLDDNLINYIMLFP